MVDTRRVDWTSSELAQRNAQPFHTWCTFGNEIHKFRRKGQVPKHVGQMATQCRLIGDIAQVRGATTVRKSLMWRSRPGSLMIFRAAALPIRQPRRLGRLTFPDASSTDDVDSFCAVQNLLARRSCDCSATSDAAAVLRALPQVSRDEDVHYGIPTQPAVLVPLRVTPRPVRS